MNNKYSLIVLLIVGGCNKNTNSENATNGISNPESNKKINQQNNNEMEASYLEDALNAVNISKCDNEYYRLKISSSKYTNKVNLEIPEELINFLSRDDDYQVEQFKDFKLNIESINGDKLSDIDLLNDIKEINSFSLHANYIREFGLTKLKYRHGDNGWSDWSRGNKLYSAKYEIKNDGKVLIYAENNNQKIFYVDISADTCGILNKITDIEFVTKTINER